LATAIGADVKGKVSVLCYFAAIALAFLNTWLSVALYILVACLWFVPDRRIERQIDGPGARSDAAATRRRPPKP